MRCGAKITLRARYFNMGIREKRENLLYQLSEAAGMAPLIEIHGSGEMLLSDCRAITDYSCEKIVVNTLMGAVSICGKRLTMSVFRGDMLSIEGTIHMICFGGNASDT